jgi:uracil-DNA glycosylase family 4
MSSEHIHEELLTIIQEVREQVEYLHELGVELYEGPALPAKPAASDCAAANQSTLTPVVSGERPKLSPLPSVPQPVAAKTITQPAKLATPSAARSPLLASLFGELDARPDDGLPDSDESFDQIWESVGQCTRCPLHEGRTNIVHTDGNKKARLMFVGEAPGADEDTQGRPFVGRAGQLLTKIIEAIGLKREDVLIGNVNRCRPPGNRAPTPEEASLCKPFLVREIAVARPEVIVVLGNTAMRNLLGTKEGITRVRGQFQNYKGIKVMPTFHPAYLLRDPSKKRETWEDLKKVRDYLDNTATT